MALGAQVALLSTIPDMVLTGNPVTLKFEASTNLISDAGSKAEIILLWTSVALADEYFDLLLAGETVRFTCKASPDNSGVQFHDNSGSLTLANWVALLASDLEKNYLIARYYDIVLSGAQMTITAKEEGSVYTQEFTAGSGIDVTPTETNKTGVDYDLAEFYYIVVLLYCNDEFITDILLTVSADGLAEVDISKYLAAYLNSEFEWPEARTLDAASVIIARDNMVIDWSFKYGERWGEGEYTALQESNNYKAIAGGLSFRQLAKYQNDSTTFWAKLQSQMYFLSWAPLTRIIGVTEPVKLFYYNHSEATTLIQKIKFYFNDSNPPMTIEKDLTSSTSDLYEIVFTPHLITGIKSYLNLQLVEKAEVWITNGSNVTISEVRTLIFDYNEYHATRYFIFKNSLGAYEVLRSTGLWNKSEDYERELSAQSLPSDFTVFDREDLTVNVLERRRFIASCGWLSRYGDAEEFRNWLRDFALSKEVYYAEIHYSSDLATLESQTLIPVRIISTSLDHGHDRDNLKAFSFEFVNAYADEFFTKEITPNLLEDSMESEFELAQ